MDPIATTRSVRTYLIVLALCAAAAIVVARGGRSGPADPPPLNMVLPDRAGSWRGEDVLFCQSEACLRAFSGDEAAGLKACPACGGPLDTVALAEKRLLPEDTLISRRKYTRPDGRSFVVTIVVGGEERKSIHRPQQCLPGQGWVIERSAILSVPIPGRPPLDMMGLDIRPEGGERAGARGVYAYWFLNRDHETPRFMTYVWQAAIESVRRGRPGRWAYVSVFGDRPAHAEGELAALRELVAALHPALNPSPSRVRQSP